jgi:hypothetical protein
VVAVSHDWQLREIDTRTSPATVRIVGRQRFTEGDIPGDVAVGTDGRIAFVSMSGHAVSTIGVDGLDERVVVEQAPGSATLFRSPAWSGDGTSLAFFTWGGGGHVEWVDVATGTVSTLPDVPPDTQIEGVGWTADRQLRLVLSKPGPSIDSARTIVEWVALDGSVKAALDLGSGVEAVAPLVGQWSLP